MWKISAWKCCLVVSKNFYGVNFIQVRNSLKTLLAFIFKKPANFSSKNVFWLKHFLKNSLIFVIQVQPRGDLILFQLFIVAIHCGFRGRTLFGKPKLPENIESGGKFCTKII